MANIPSANVKSAATSNTPIVEGPAWDNSSEYPGVKSKEFLAEIELVKSQLQDLETLNLSLQTRLRDLGENQHVAHRASTIQDLMRALRAQRTTGVLIGNLSVYASCENSVDASDVDIKNAQATVAPLSVKFRELTQPFWLFLRRCDEACVQEILADPELKALHYLIARSRLQKDLLLSDAEELMITSLTLSGHTAWAKLYDAISGTLKCEVAGERIGLAHAAGNLRDADEALRKKSWLAIQGAWESQKESCTAILNSLVGWRLTEVKKRSHTRKVDFLSEPCFQNGIERETLEAMLAAVQEDIQTARRSMSLMAKVARKPVLDPWDLLAPCPSEGAKPIPYADGLKLVRESFATVDQSMADFVAVMDTNRWIEGRVLPNKQQGGYCTRFAKSRTSRIFQTYMGSPNDVSTLAHELGHAYHDWSMRDMPRELTYYSSSLAETASIFAETVVTEAMMAQSTDLDSKLQVGWDDIANVASLLINIPMRFEFEKELNERRGVREVNSDELCEMMQSASEKWFGPTLSQHDRMFWASKMHFHMSGRSFYNFPYTFGYLFSLSIYGRRKDMGADFISSYNAILRDTGSMTAEALVQKHLGEDIRSVDFWRKSLQVVKAKVDAFEKLSFQLDQ